MSSPEGGEVWTGSQLAARLAALNGAAPEPSQHIVFRATRHADGRISAFYRVPGEPRPLAAGALNLWLSRRGLKGPERLAVAVLVVRETLDAAGLIRQCVLEHRRGGIDGPFHGRPARVELLGAADQVRLYEARLDGRLVEIPPSAETTVPGARSLEHFAAAHAALKARWGDGVQLIDAREPTLFEDLVGISSIMHVRAEADRQVGCAVIWHGDIPVVLEGSFPRLGVALDFPPADAAAVDAAIATHQLLRGQTRLDEHGLALLARRLGEEQLMLLRPGSDGVQLEPHTPGRNGAAPDQLRWMHYAETYEGLSILDAWHDGKSSDLIVLTGDLGGLVWRHHIDIDGVETWRRNEDDAAIGGLHRERLSPGTIAAELADRGESAEAAMHRGAADSMLARAQAFVRASAALRDSGDGSAGAEQTIRRLDGLLADLTMLEAHRTADTAKDILTRLRRRDVRPTDLAGQLALIETALHGELAQSHVLCAAQPFARFLQRMEPPFGADVAAAFPADAYDVEEAALCLALRRPTAAVFHCMKVVWRGIESLMRHCGITDPFVSDARTWRQVWQGLGVVSDPRFTDAVDALKAIETRWRNNSLRPADKYTEEEAELIFRAVGQFMQLLAGLHARPDEATG